jgi:hypothetical protein
LSNREKVAFKDKNKAKLKKKTARLNLDQAWRLLFCDSSILTMAAEAIVRGFDSGSVIHYFIYTNPGTDVVDFGSDISNSEILNSFLNIADITETGVITEAALRRVYDVYAQMGTRVFTERWSDPGARLCSTLYIWHIVNDRHWFLRRIVLAYPMISKTPVDQRDAEIQRNIQLCFSHHRFQ